MFELTGKVALITGASSGIGAAAAMQLAKQGAHVVLAARRYERLTQLASQIQASGARALALQMDVTDKTTIEKGIASAIATFGRLDILVNNAGIAENAAFMDMTEAVWDRTLATNLKGCFLVAQGAASEMAQKKWGRIINIASIAMGGQGVGFPNIAHYCASKGGIIALTESLADELAPLGILVNAIAPGLIATEMTAGITSDKAQLAAMTSRIPLKRAGTPEEIASAIGFLASVEASYITGSTLVIDGGWLAS
jgi:NAD(P)-dependent dehydrogenase (short-subunit alcohol dehydrogenase family)